MGVIYSTAVKTNRITATRDYFANGTLEILDGTTVLVTYGLSAAGGTISTDTWSLVFDAATVAAGAAGIAGVAQVKDSVGTIGITGLTVGTETGVPETEPDVTLDNTNIANGQNVTLPSAVIKHA